MTYFCVSDMTGVDLAEEDAKFMAYLREQGWDGEVGEDDEMQQIATLAYGDHDEAAEEKK